VSGGARFVLRMAGRELRAAPRRLLLFVGAVGVGVAALVAINSFTDNLRDSVAAEAKSLLGADLAFTSRRAFPPRAAATIDSVAAGAAQAEVTTFAGMAFVPRTEGTRLVQVTAVEGPYPFYGEIRTEPDGAWRRLQDDRHVLVDPSLLVALGARVGDTLSLGRTRFAIIGTVLNAPGDVGIRTAFGPRIFIPGRYLAETALLGFGARAEHERFLQLAPGADAAAIAKRLRAPLRAERVRVRTVADDQANLTELLERLTSYLGLVALVALLLGGLGVGSAAYAWVRQRLDTIAILRCLGATAPQVVAIYLLQAVGMGLAGALAGAAAGVALQTSLPAVLGDFLPVQVQVRPSPAAIATGVATGLWVAFVFALLPILGVRQVPPLLALRRDVEGTRRHDPLLVPAIALLAASIVLLASRQVGSWRSGLGFSAGVAVAVLLLWLAAWGLMRGVRRWFPDGWPYVWRQGLANLFRPANQTTAVVLALGFGAFVLSTLFLVQHNLLRQLAVDGRADRPNLLLLDIQADQRAGVDSLAATVGRITSAPVPIVPMRVQRVKGVAVTPAPRDALAEAGADSAAPGGGRGGWALRREYRSTYRDTLVRSEKLVAGRFWDPGDGDRDGTWQVSVEQGVAQELGVGLGDEITWDVQGVPIRTRVTSLREVDWARFEPNFFVVFQPGALQAAPQTLVSLVRVDDPAARGRLQRALAERFPNVTSVDLTLVQQAVEGLVDRVALAIRFMALFTLVTGAVVLVGAVTTSRAQREREGALLKTLGASRRQVLRIVAAEYASVGLLASGAAMLLACAAGWAIQRFVFEQPFRIPTLSLSLLAAFVAVACVAIGVGNSLGVVRKTPLEVLRGD